MKKFIPSKKFIASSDIEKPSCIIVRLSSKPVHLIDIDPIYKKMLSVSELKKINGFQEEANQ